MSLTGLKLVHQQECGYSAPHPLYLLCVFRDEDLLLEYFFNYYRSLGVTHFIMVDNLSEDEGAAYLERLKDINIRLYQAEGGYRDAAYGTTWVNQLLEEHCIGQYCLTVDVDELFLFDNSKFGNLHQLIDSMESSGSNVVPLTLLDMYPKETNDSYQKGQDFLIHSPFFDNLNSTYYKAARYYGKQLHSKGGMRKRVFDATVCIHKFSLFKYDFYPLGMAPGYHFFKSDDEIIFESDSIKPFEQPAVLLHFKFIKPNLGAFFKRRVMLNQDWNESAEYKCYAETYAETIPGKSSIAFFDNDYSSELKNIQNLKAFFSPIVKPRISVLIPVHNVEKYINKCLYSVRNQTLQEIEIICVDDCSPDESASLIERHAAKDFRITLIRHEKNLGLGGARNTAIRAAKADFIASVDSDDTIEPNMLEVLWEATEDGKIDVVCCGFDKVDNKGKRLSSHVFPSRTIENKSDSMNIFSVVNPAFWNKLWRRSLFINNDIFFPDHLYYEDMATTPRILANVKNVRIIDNCLYHYLVREGSITQTFGPRHMMDYFKVFEIILDFLEEKSLVGRYNEEFKQYVDLGVRFHSQQVLDSDMDKNELEQYLRHFLMLKIAFLEYYGLIKSMDQGKLLSLLETAQSKEDIL